MTGGTESHIELTNGGLADFYAMQERHFQRLENRPGLKWREWVGLAAIMVSTAFGAGMYVSQMQADLREDITQAEQRWAEKVAGIESRWVERVSGLARDFDSRLIAAVVEIKKEIPPKHVELRFDEIEKDILEIKSIIKTNHNGG